MALSGFAVVTMIAAVASFIAGGQNEPTGIPLIRLKPADPEMRRLMTDGYARSATFRTLVDDIHRTNGVVVVQFGMCANGRFRSCVTNVDGNEQQRSVRVKVNTRTTDDRLIATIAHELEHALEILRDPLVTTPQHAMALYRRIGQGPCREGLSEACETAGALRVEAVVNEELANGVRR